MLRTSNGERTTPSAEKTAGVTAFSGAAKSDAKVAASVRMRRVCGKTSCPRNTSTERQ